MSERNPQTGNVSESGARRVTGQQEIVEILEWDIILGQIHQRERLVEDQLIERFGSTRHKVRMALDELARRGLIRQIRNKGAQVRDYDETEIRGLYDIRNALQTQAIRRMTFPFSPNRIARLSQIHAEHLAAGEAGLGRKMFYLNEQFHNEFFEACRLPVLAEAIREYASRTHPIRSRGFFDAAYRSRAQADHAEIIALSACSDPAEALIDVNCRHINRPRDRYFANLASPMTQGKSGTEI